MIYTGIDIAKKKFDYCIVDSKLRIIKRGILINNSSGFSEFLRIIKNYRNIKIGMESTNIYHVNLYTYLINNNRNTILLNPIETKLLKSSKIRKNKTDKIDAEAIAKYIIIRKNNIITMEKNWSVPPEFGQFFSVILRHFHLSSLYEFSYSLISFLPFCFSLPETYSWILHCYSIVFSNSTGVK